MKFLLSLLLLLFLGLVGIFAIQNNDTIVIEFLKWSLTAPLALVTVAIYLLGMLSGWTVVSMLRRTIRTVTEPRRD